MIEMNNNHIPSKAGVSESRECIAIVMWFSLFWLGTTNTAVGAYYGKVPLNHYRHSHQPQRSYPALVVDYCLRSTSI
jgi:hypothetical protein